MLPDRSWICRRLDMNGSMTIEFKLGVDEFIQFVIAHPQAFDAASRILCPCAKCKNNRWNDLMSVQRHLYKHGFDDRYTNWTFHGEEIWGSSSSSHTYNDFGGQENNPYVAMVMDANVGAGGFDDTEEEPNPRTQNFFEMLRYADELLWEGCKKHTVLSAVTQLLNLKSEFSLSVNCFDRMIAIIKSMLPESEKLPDSFYKTKRLVSELGLGYEKIDVCRNFCVLYYKEHQDLTQCPVCRESRYRQTKEGSTSARNVSYKSVRYLPIAPRLKRLYLSHKTAEFMRWHANGIRHDESLITHPSDATAWQHFNATHPTFAKEIRNVRIGLCTDGFNPFNSSSYSCWPVFVTPYNLPPSMLMKREFMFLTLLIPGPKSPGRNLDICLRPLIDELHRLWVDGEVTFDVLRKQNFLMKVALMWTVSDFPAYGMLSGWSTHGKLACPYCGDKSGSFVLKHGRKCCWFDCHRQFLPRHHPFRRDKNSFTKSRDVKSRPPIRKSGSAVLDEVNRLHPITFGFLSGKQKQPGFGQQHNWVKKSIFWELPYWSSNLLRHNLDVMHVEKNVFDNIFNTIMDVKDRTKDNANARLDMQLICSRPQLELIDNGGGLGKPKATYVLDATERKIVCEWIKQLKFPDGYASNIGRCINSDDGKIYGMKSHDCHVFMQRLLPLAFREILPKQIWGPLVELSNFFKDLSSSKFRVSTMEAWESRIIETICKLEKIFPPGFFDVMEHLIIHLPYEAKVGGIIHPRWMYPFEREMLFLKRRVHNRARVEASICESYIVHEISNFVSLYFESYLKTNRTQLPRNDDGGELPNDYRLSVFHHPCRPLGRYRHTDLSDRDLHTVETYVITNTTEMEPYLRQFEDFARSANQFTDDDEYLRFRDAEFCGWLKRAVRSGLIRDPKIQSLSYGPLRRVKCYNGIIVNGYRFHTKDYEQHKATMNSGVCCRGSYYGDNELDYYGVIEDIIELSYVGQDENLVVFRCHWFDPSNGVKIDKQYNLVDVNPRSLLQTYEPFILVQQAQQVYYTRYPTKRGRSVNDWWAACKVRPRLFDPESVIDDSSETNVENVVNDYYQEDAPTEMIQPDTNQNEEIQLRDANDAVNSIEINEIYIPLNFESVEQQIIEGEFGEENTTNYMDDYNTQHDLDADSE